MIGRCIRVRLLHATSACTECSGIVIRDCSCFDVKHDFRTLVDSLACHATSACAFMGHAGCMELLIILSRLQQSAGFLRSWLIETCICFVGLALRCGWVYITRSSPLPRLDSPRLEGGCQEHAVGQMQLFASCAVTSLKTSLKTCRTTTTDTASGRACDSTT